jgi:phage shock protein B
MSHSAFVLSLIFMTCVLPLIVIMHYVTKWKSTKGLSDEEQRMLEQLWESSERMHKRIRALETILDDQIDSAERTNMPKHGTSGEAQAKRTFERLR